MTAAGFSRGEGVRYNPRKLGVIYERRAMGPRVLAPKREGHESALCRRGRANLTRKGGMSSVRTIMHGVLSAPYECGDDV